MSERIKSLRLESLRVTPKTVWTFLTLTTERGVEGFGEATLTGEEAAVTAAAAAARGAVLGGTVESVEDLPVAWADLPQAAFRSALCQAACDAQARTEGVSLGELLAGRGKAVAAAVPTYANVNRRTLDRSPAGFAAGVGDAVKAGARAFKIAPFDGVRPNMAAAEYRPLMQAGIARIAAVRECLGADKRLMVDCHWRFSAAAAAELAEAIRGLGLYWLECPVPDPPERVDVLKNLRTRLHADGTLLAGLETAVGRGGFRPYLEAGAYDVVMPDVKYAGGPREMLRIARDCRAYGVGFSPHNPSGPICRAHSLHLCAAVEGSDLLETQFDETPLFDALVGNRLPAGGCGAAPMPAGAGLALTLDRKAAATCERTAVWQAG